MSVIRAHIARCGHDMEVTVLLTTSQLSQSENKEPWLTAREVADRLKINVSSLHKLCRKPKSPLRSMMVGTDRYFKDSWVRAYEENEDAQKRRRHSWRRDPHVKRDEAAGTLAKDAEPRGPLPGHNLAPEARTVTRLEVDAGEFDVQVSTEAGKHIIHSSRSTPAALSDDDPQASPPVSPTRCIECQTEAPEPGLTRCHRCLRRDEKRGLSIEEMMKLRLATMGSESR